MYIATRPQYGDNGREVPLNLSLRRDIWRGHRWPRRGNWGKRGKGTRGDEGRPSMAATETHGEKGDEGRTKMGAMGTGDKKEEGVSKVGGLTIDTPYGG